MTTNEVIAALLPLGMAAIVGSGALLLARWLRRDEDRYALELERRRTSVAPKS